MTKCFMSKIEIGSIPVGVSPLASRSSPMPQSVVLRTCELEVDSSIPAWQKFFLKVDDNHCKWIHSSLTVVCCFNNGYVGKQQVVWKEYCAAYWLKKLQKSMDKCSGHHAITEMLLKTALNTIQSINQPLASVSVSFGLLQSVSDHSHIFH